MEAVLKMREKENKRRKKKESADEGKKEGRDIYLTGSAGLRGVGAMQHALHHPYYYYSRLEPIVSTQATYRYLYLATNLSVSLYLYLFADQAVSHSFLLLSSPAVEGEVKEEDDGYVIDTEIHREIYR